MPPTKFLSGAMSASTPLSAGNVNSGVRPLGTKPTIVPSGVMLRLPLIVLVVESENFSAPVNSPLALTRNEPNACSVVAGNRPACSRLTRQTPVRSA